MKSKMKGTNHLMKIKLFVYELEGRRQGQMKGGLYRKKGTTTLV